MKNLVLCLLVLVFFGICSASESKDIEPIKSTQGIELQGEVEKSKEPQDIKNEQKQKRNRSKIYLKKKKKIRKQEYKRKLKQRELEHLEKRLETKQLKLDTLTTNPEKGEQE